MIEEKSSLTDGLLMAATLIGGGVMGAYARLTFIKPEKRPSPAEAIGVVVASGGAAVFGAPLAAQLLAHNVSFLEADDLRLVGFLAWALGIAAAKIVMLIAKTDFAKVINAFNPWKKR